MGYLHSTVYDTNLTRFNLSEVRVEKGEPIVPPPHPGSFYIDDWGFIGNKTGGWKLTPGEFIGNVSIGGNHPNSERTAILGGFETLELRENYSLNLNGKMEFIGGGFEAANSLRFGLFFSNSAGYLINYNTDSSRWTGTENYHFGYLFVPPTGTIAPVKWNGTSATIGAVVDNFWFNPDGINNYPLNNILQAPSGAIPIAGMYNFNISIAPVTDTTTEIIFNISEENLEYAFHGTVIDKHKPLVTKKINYFALALDSGNTTTAINLYDVEVISEDYVVGVEGPGENIIPTKNSLSQNYPNPFNPTTNIEFRITEYGFVSLKIYDVLGKEVAILVNEEKPAGTYTINFNGSNLASGIYFYQLKAENSFEIKKLILLK